MYIEPVVVVHEASRTCSFFPIFSDHTWRSAPLHVLSRILFVSKRVDAVFAGQGELLGSCPRFSNFTQYWIGHPILLCMATGKQARLRSHSHLQASAILSACPFGMPLCVGHLDIRSNGFEVQFPGGFQANSERLLRTLPLGLPD